MEDKVHPSSQGDLQSDALSIRQLLEAANLLLNNNEMGSLQTLLEVALEKATELTSALDIVNGRIEQ